LVADQRYFLPLVSKPFNLGQIIKAQVFIICDQKTSNAPSFWTFKVSSNELIKPTPILGNNLNANWI
jgi:hypothetical protein